MEPELRFPRLSDLGQRNNVALAFTGVSLKPLIGDNELSGGLNLSGDNLPALSPSPLNGTGIAVASASSSIGTAGGKLCWNDGTDFKYDGVSKGTVTAGVKCYVDFGGSVVIFPDKKYYCYDASYADYGTFGTFTAPDVTMAVTHKNRIFGIAGKELRACQWGDFKVWDRFVVDALDSWALTLYENATPHGIFKYQDHIQFWIGDTMYELYGAIPAQFTLQEVGPYVIKNLDSAAEANGMMVFMCNDGMKVYTGGLPYPFGQEIWPTVGETVSVATDGRRIFVNNGTKTYAYDTLGKSWLPYDELNVLNYTRIDNTVYALVPATTNYQIVAIGTGGYTARPWEAITKEFDDSAWTKKYTYKVKLRAQMTIGSTLTVSYKVDGATNWTVVKTITAAATGDLHQIINVPIKRARKYQIKISGTGYSLVHGIREFGYGSEPPMGV